MGGKLGLPPIQNRMSIVYKCPSCGAAHPCRMLALRRRYFDDVIPQLGEVIELCPHTRAWVTITYSHMTWKEATPVSETWI